MKPHQSSSSSNHVDLYFLTLQVNSYKYIQNLNLVALHYCVGQRKAELREHLKQLDRDLDTGLTKEPSWTHAKLLSSESALDGSSDDERTD